MGGTQGAAALPLPEASLRGQGMSEGKRACVIGAGIGGLALAIRLQSAGVATTLVEARDRPGGRAHASLQDCFTFDAGPGLLADLAPFQALWELGGHDIAADLEFLPVEPVCRFSWPDGTQFDFTQDEAALRREIARLDPRDIAGYDALLAHRGGLERDCGDLMNAGRPPGVGPVLKAVPALARHRAWMPLHDTVSRFIREPKLRAALTVHALLAGANPLTARSAHSPLFDGNGAWWPRGGMNRLGAAMLRQFERLGGETRLHDPVTAIHTSGARASEVETLSGWREPFDSVASNADLVHTYRDLLRGSPRGAQLARRLARKSFSPSLFTVHFGIEGAWPGIPHHMVLFGPRYESLLEDVFDRGVLPADLVIFLDHPTVTDPSLAPEGRSVFQAAVPVAHMGKLAVDWEQVGPMLEQRVLAEVERRLIPDLADRIVTRSHYSPRDRALDFSAHLGSAFGLEPIPAQSGWLRPRDRDEVIANLYRVGTATRPGGGVSGVLEGAETTAARMVADLVR